jgi:hypothetical protein
MEIFQSLIIILKMIVLCDECCLCKYVIDFFAIFERAHVLFVVLIVIITYYLCNICMNCNFELASKETVYFREYRKDDKLHQFIPFCMQLFQNIISFLTRFFNLKSYILIFMVFKSRILAWKYFLGN